MDSKTKKELEEKGTCAEAHYQKEIAELKAKVKEYEEMARKAEEVIKKMQYVIGEVAK